MDTSATVRQLYSDFNARNIDAVLAVLTDDVAWANGQHGGHVHGHEAVRAYWTQQWASLDPRVEPADLRSRDDGSVEVRVRQVVHDLEGALLLDEHVTHAFHFRGDRVARFDIEQAGQLSSLS